jgi:hypothetical protein
MNLLFTTPITRAALDGGSAISGITILAYSLDPDALTGTVRVRAIEDGPSGMIHTVTVGPFAGSTTIAQQLAALKTALAAALQVTFK